MMKSANCSNCGGSINIDEMDLNGYSKCEFCKTSHKIIDIISIDGLPTVKSLLSNAEIALKQQNFEKAIAFSNDIVKIKHNCHEAWWYLYICNREIDRYYNYKDKYGNDGPFTKAEIMSQTIEKYGNNAIEFAPEAIRQTYRDEMKEEVDFVNDVKAGKYDIKKNGKSGCYIATAVYGSYSCTEVFALRRFRDEYLEKYALGKGFIKLYYLVSPSLAKNIKSTSLIAKYTKNILNTLIRWI